MQRIMIIGNCGTGKSTLSKTLADKTGLPLHHLDRYYWKPGWIPSADDEWNESVKELASGNKWIIEGNYNRTMDIRLERADTIILLEKHRLVCVYRILKRLAKSKFDERTDVAQGCRDKFDWEFIKWVWSYKNRGGSTIKQRLAALENKNIHILKTNNEINDFLYKVNQLSDTAGFNLKINV